MRSRLHLRGKGSCARKRYRWHRWSFSDSSQRLSCRPLDTSCDSSCSIRHNLELGHSEDCRERCLSEALCNLFEVIRKGWSLEQCDAFIDGVWGGERTQEASIAAICRTTENDVLAVKVAIEQLEIGFRKSNQSTTLAGGLTHLSFLSQQLLCGCRRRRNQRVDGCC